MVTHMAGVICKEGMHTKTLVRAQIPSRRYLSPSDSDPIFLIREFSGAVSLIFFVPLLYHKNDCFPLASTYFQITWKFLVLSTIRYAWILN